MEHAGMFPDRGPTCAAGRLRAAGAGNEASTGEGETNRSAVPASKKGAHAGASHSGPSGRPSEAVLLQAPGMGYPIDVALRYLGSKKRAFISVGTAFAILGVTLGVAALATVMSV